MNNNICHITHLYKKVFLTYGLFVKIIEDDKELLKIKIKNVCQIVFLKDFFCFITTTSELYLMNYEDYSIIKKVKLNGQICTTVSDKTKNTIYLSTMNFNTKKTYLYKIDGDIMAKEYNELYFISLCGFDNNCLKVIKRNVKKDCSFIVEFDLSSLNEISEKKIEDFNSPVFNLDEKYCYYNIGIYDYINDKRISLLDLKLDISCIINAKNEDNLYYLFSNKKVVILDKTFSIVNDCLDDTVLDMTIVDGKKYFVIDDKILTDYCSKI